jgi:DNA-binding protein HU-beta
MTKDQLVSQLAKESQMTIADSKKFVNAFVNVLVNNFKKREELRLLGLGSFTVHHSKARTGRNPMTGTPLDIKAKYSMKFKISKDITEAMNS